MAHALLASLLLFGSGYQDPAEPSAFTLKTRETITGRLLGVEGDKALIKVSIMDGSATIRRRLADFTPESEFRIRMQATPPKSFEDHMKMAQTAIELGIPPQAGELAGRARKLAEADESGAQKKRLDAWAATTLETLFTEAIRQGDVVGARHYLKLLATRVPEERSEDQLGKMFDDLATAEMKRRTAARTEAAPTEAAAGRAETDQLWEPVLKRVKQADKLVREGLRNSRRTVQATRSYEQAIEHYRAAWGEVQAILKEHGNDATVQEDAAHLGERIRDSGVQAALHAGNALAVQGDYRSALEWANKVLSIDPANRDAKSLIHTIQIAQTQGWGWGSGWAR